MRISVQRSLRGLACCCLVLLAGCAKTQPPVTAATASLPPMTVDDLVARELASDDVLLIGAGDIADCGSQLQHAKDTAAIIQRFPAATVFAAGDDAYGTGTKEEFETCYENSWGGFKARTRPSPGNHDYGIYPPVLRRNADPYFDYLERARARGASATTATTWAAGTSFRSTAWRTRRAHRRWPLKSPGFSKTSTGPRSDAFWPSGITRCSAPAIGMAMIPGIPAAARISSGTSFSSIKRT